MTRLQTSSSARFLERQHAFYRLLPQSQRRDLLHFVERFLAGRDIALERPDSRLDLLVAAGAALVGMYQPVDDFSAVDWIYLGESDSENDGETWGNSRLLLDSRAVIEESASVIPGHQIVVHEFAHVLDQMRGFSGRTAAIRDALETHLEILNRGGESCIVDWRDSIPIEAAMDSEFRYLEQVEFFAYASEAFFTTPRSLREELPALYDELLVIYRIDTARLQPA